VLGVTRAVASTLTRSHWLLSPRQALHSALSADAAAHSFPQADRAALDKRVADAEARAAAAAAALSVEVRTHARRPPASRRSAPG
jgi:hypothetical protein